jgi:CBS domain-containing protein
MNNSIAQRIADFLSKYAPFRLIDEKQLLELCQRVEVTYKEQGDLIFEQGESVHAFFYVIREGAVQLTRKEGAEQLLVDICDEGDIFGLRPLLADQPYGLRAQAKENSLLYAIPVQYFKTLMAGEAGLSLYLAKYFAAGVHLSYDNAYRNAYYFHPEQKKGTNLTELQRLQTRREPVTGTINDSIQTAARIMQAARVSSILIVNAHNQPRGIITDKDLRNQIATGEKSINDNVQSVMSSPVLCIPEGLTVAEVQVFMIKHKVHHLAVTQDGTDQSPLLGVITEHDLLVAQANNPAALVRKIKHSYSLSALRDIRERAEDLLSKYLEQEVAIAFISEVMSQINDALIQRIIELEAEQMDHAGYNKPEVHFCWLSLGSEGREEQLLRTDQDNALVFADVAPADLEQTRKYFLALAQNVNKSLAACGFEYCPSEMMARNPKWCLSLSEWRQQFKKWMMSPSQDAILLSTIFFDFRPVYGDFTLSDTLTQFIFEHIDQRTPFLHFLAKDAVQNPPPLSFFRNFLVEKNGVHKNTFDIKARAMMPLVDAARLLSLAAKKESTTNTVQRYRHLAEQERANRELYLQAAEAYEILLGIRARFGLQNDDSGRYIQPASLSKMERLQLRNCFKPISELQSLLSTRYQLAYLM